MKCCDVLGHQNLTFDDLLRSEDLLSEYKSQNVALDGFLGKAAVFERIIEVFVSSSDQKALNVIVSLFTCQNQYLLKKLTQNRKSIEAIFGIFSKEDSSISGKIILVMNIMVYAFNLREREMYAIFNSSSTIFPILLKNIEQPAVFSLFQTLISNISQSQAFLWFFFKELMDEHTVGVPTPEFVATEFALSEPSIHLLPEQRRFTLEILNLFFEMWSKECYPEFSHAVWQGLPLLLQDSNTDMERATVFKLAYHFQPRNPIISSAISVVSCFRVPMDLLLSALNYLSICKYRMQPDAALLLLYRLVYQKASILIVKATLPLFRVISDDKRLVSNLLGILTYCFEQNQWEKSFSTRSIRLLLTNSITGSDEITTETFSGAFIEFMTNPASEFVDNSLIKMLKGKSSQPVPIRYNAISLLGQELDTMSSMYPVMNKLSHLKALLPKKFADDTPFVPPVSNSPPSPESVSDSPFSSSDKIRNFGSQFSTHSVDEFDSSNEIDRIGFVPPPPQLLSGKKSYHFGFSVRNKELLDFSASEVYERPMNEYKNRKTQSKTTKYCDSSSSTDPNVKDKMISKTTENDETLPGEISTTTIIIDPDDQIDESYNARYYKSERVIRVIEKPVSKETFSSTVLNPIPPPLKNPNSGIHQPNPFLDQPSSGHKLVSTKSTSSLPTPPMFIQPPKGLPDPPSKNTTSYNPQSNVLPNPFLQQPKITSQNPFLDIKGSPNPQSNPFINSIPPPPVYESPPVNSITDQLPPPPPFKPIPPQIIPPISSSISPNTSIPYPEHPKVINSNPLTIPSTTPIPAKTVQEPTLIQNNILPPPPAFNIPAKNPTPFSPSTNTNSIPSPPNPFLNSLPTSQLPTKPNPFLDSSQSMGTLPKTNTTNINNQPSTFTPPPFSTNDSFLAPKTAPNTYNPFLVPPPNQAQIASPPTNINSLPSPFINNLPPRNSNNQLPSFTPPIYKK